jgi:acyl-CoA thioesterase-2
MPQEDTPQQLVDNLVALLKVEPSGENHFTGAATPAGQGTGTGRVFGGQVVAQALAAAEATVPEDRPAASLHAYFLRAGDDTKPIDFAVDRDLDGGSFSNRRVVASQDGKPILTLSASFHRLEPGVHHQDAMPDVTGPDELLGDLEQRRLNLDRIPPERIEAFLAARALEHRSVESHLLDSSPAAPVSHVWFRATAPLGDDPRVHRAVLAYASDFAMLRTSMLPHGLNWLRGEVREASLDHAVWFHDDFRADEWLLHATDSPWAGRARGFTRGQIFSQDGRLVASVSQEGLIRDMRK